MNKLITLIVSVFLLSMANVVGAVPILNIGGDDIEDISAGVAYDHYQNSGEYMYFKEANNMGVRYSDGTLEAEVADWLGINGYNVSGFTLTDSTADVVFTIWNGTHDVLDDPDDSKSGTWAVIPPGNTISLYAVKASNAYAMYLVDPADGWGSWSTYDLYSLGYGGNDGVEISHFTAYNSTSTPVPEPATMLLFGTGLVGISIKTRKHIKK